jgi:hypothetical protein
MLIRIFQLLRMKISYYRPWTMTMPINTQFNNPFEGAANALMQYGLQQQQNAPQNAMYAAQAAKAQQDAEYQAKMRAAASELAANPTATGIEKMMFQFPEVAQHYAQGLDAMSKNERESALVNSSIILAYRKKGRDDLAANHFDYMISAAEHSGKHDAATKYQVAKANFLKDPASAELEMMARQRAMMDPADWTKQLTQEADVARSKSESEKAKYEATKAQSEAQTEIQYGGPLKQAQVAGQSAEFVKKQGEVSDREGKGAAQIGAIDEAIKSIQGVDGQGGLIQELGRPEHKGVFVDATGVRSRWLPTTHQSTADLESTIESVKSKLGLMVESKGDISNSERESLQNAIGSLSTSLSPEKLQENASAIVQTLMGRRDRLQTQYGISNPSPKKTSGTAWSVDQVRRAAADSGMSFEDAVSKIVAAGHSIK